MTPSPRYTVIKVITGALSLTELKTKFLCVYGKLMHVFLV